MEETAEEEQKEIRVATTAAGKHPRRFNKPKVSKMTYQKNVSKSLDRSGGM
jgi:hypothetical protein